MPMDEHFAEQIPVIKDILAAHRRITDDIRKTPVISDPQLNAVLGCELWLKCENLQRTGAFKFRGASNAIAVLEEAKRYGDVATHSSGNHGAALALAASTRGRRSWIVMPENSVKTKIDAVSRNGGEIIFCPPSQAEREKGLADLVARGCIAIPPYDHADIICGQGTAMLELANQRPDLEIIITPVGGGGLLSGTAIAARALMPATVVIGAEPEGAADTALSLARGERVVEYPVNTIADGLRAIIGVMNFEIIRANVNEVVTVTETGIIDAMALIWQHFRMLIEPSSATVITAIMEKPQQFAGKRVGAIISGGNVDLKRIPFET